MTITAISTNINAKQIFSFEHPANNETTNTLIYVNTERESLKQIKRYNAKATKKVVTR